jgi:hypothetical protein
MGKHTSQKLHELIIYVTQQRGNDALFDAAHLSRLLFAADFTRYRQNGASITGSTYIATPHGPMPEGLPDTLAGMREQGWLAPDTHAANGAHPSRIVALRAPDSTRLTPEEIALVDGIVAEQRKSSPDGQGDPLQTFLGWRAIPHGQRIPYGTALLSKPELTPTEVAFGLALSEQLAAPRER